MIVVTGANGKLGQLVVDALLKANRPETIVAGVRQVEKADVLRRKGVQVRRVDYESPATLDEAFAGAEKILLISSSEVGKREGQHRNVIEAARKRGVRQLAYTSVLRADSSRLGLAREHLATEVAIRQSGLPFTFLRNGWYLENHTENLGAALQHGVILGAAGAGRFSSASRRDFAEAAAAVLGGSGHENRVYELAGDGSFTLSELAAEAARVFDRVIAYQDMSTADFERALAGFGLPGPIAQMLADSDEGAKNGELRSDSRDLSRLILRPTTTLREALEAQRVLGGKK